MEINNTRSSKRRRVSLTKSQRLSIAGVELLSLCQTITKDGSISDEEINDLNDWLKNNRSSELPSIDYLTTTIDNILADKKITKEERTELHKALEAVLPPEIR